MGTKAEFLDGLEFKLGQNVRTIGSNMEGMISTIVLYDSGMVHYAVQPPGDGKTLPEAHYFDGVSLEFVDEGHSAKTIPVTEVNLVNGMQVRDKVSGLKGYITGEIYSMNGCIHFMVQSGLDKDGKYMKPTGFDHTRLEEVGKPVAPPAPARVSGGPPGEASGLEMSR